MTNEDQKKWNERYSSAQKSTPAAAEILEQNQHLLPTNGKALDLACGRAGNAFCLAKNGLDTAAWDISDVVIQQLDASAKIQGLAIVTEARDVCSHPPAPRSFDVIVVSRFLERSLFPAFKDAIKPGGLIFYQTFIKDKVADVGPGKPDYLLDENELLSLFPDWIIRVYREEGSVGVTDRGFRNEAGLIAQKPK